MKERLRVAINAQLNSDGGSGGIVTVLRALASLAHLEDGPEEYVFILRAPAAAKFLRGAGLRRTPFPVPVV